MFSYFLLFFLFFFNDTATTDIYTLSLHDALPIYMFRSYSRKSLLWSRVQRSRGLRAQCIGWVGCELRILACRLRSEGTRLNSSHANISYAVFCLKKKKNKITTSSK